MKSFVVWLLAVCPAAFAILMYHYQPREVWGDSRTGQMYVLKVTPSTNCWDIKPEFYPDSSLPGLGFQASIKYSLRKYSKSSFRWFGLSREEARVQSVDSCPEGWTRDEGFKRGNSEKISECSKVLPLPNLTFYLDTGVNRTIKYSAFEKKMVLKNCYCSALERLLAGGGGCSLFYPDYFDVFVVRDDFGVYHRVIHGRIFDDKKGFYRSFLYYTSDSWLCATGWYADVDDWKFNYNHMPCYYDLPDPKPFDEKLSPLKWTE